MPLSATSLLAALALQAAPAAPAVDPAEVDAAIERGVEFLLGTWKPRGTYAVSFEQRYGEVALVLYALLESGADPRDERILATIGYLARGEPEHTYDAGLLILALVAHGPAEHFEWIQDTADLLLKWQKPSGWAYPAGACDLSNTQFAALGLHAAAGVGATVPEEAWRYLARAVRRYRGKDGGFSYGRGGGSSPSMTAAGVGTIAICERALARQGVFGREEASAFSKLREAGLDALAESLPGVLQSSWYYALYGVERVGALANVTHIGGHDWYDAGAASLIASQQADGRWSESASEQAALVPTSFALLFLRRATRRTVTEAGYGAASARFGTPDAAGVRVVATGGDPLVLWIQGWGEAVRERMTWPGERRRGPRVARVEYLADGATIATVEHDPARPCELERFPVTHRFDSDGAREIVARVHVSLPAGEGGGRTEVVESPPFTVPIELGEPAWLRAERSDRARNLLGAARPRATASSEWRGDGERGRARARLATDGRMRTCWLADPEDDTPRLRLVLRGRARFDRLLLAGPRSVPYRPGAFRRPVHVEVLLRGGGEDERFVVAMPPDERRKGVLRLDRPREPRVVELTILASAPGELHGSTGLAEVELQLSGGTDG